jgi:type IV secretion system protein VirD4
MTPRESVAAWRPHAEQGAAHFASRAGKVLLIALAGVVIAQYLAGYLFLWSLRSDPRQATPLTIAQYGYYFSDREHVRTRLIAASGAGAALVILTSGAFLLPRRRSLHGDARFATRREIATAGLLSDQGVVLGRIGRRCLMLRGQQGVALAAPPRSGKGVGVVVPNALTWPGSLVCIDIKKENWTLTAGYRKQCGQDCFLFDPFAEDGNTAHWNPFFYVSSEPHRRVNDLQRIADMLYPDPPNVDPFWTASARSLFLGIALYLFETPSLPRTIGEVLRQGMASDDEGFGQHWKRLIEGRNSGRFPLSSQCVRSLYDVIDLAPVTASSIRKTFTSRLDLWLNPILDAATSSNDFDLRDLRKQPLSVYVGVNPDDLHRLRPVLNLFFQQSIGLQTRELPERNPELKHQVMMLLDEFTALGRIPIIAESISYLPGYNVRVVLVIQTPAQLREVYGPNGAETMLKSLAARIVFAPKDFPDAREISDELGFMTVPVKTLSRPTFDLSRGSARRSRSVSVSEQRRALLLPQEVKALGSDDAIVFYEGLRPIRCKKIRYFKDRRFKERLLPPPTSAAPERAARSSSASVAAVTSSAHRAGAAEGGHDMQQVELEFRAPEAVRDATLADIDRIESLTLDDFAADFDKVKLPEKADGERMTSDELRVAAESFLATLREH